MKEKDLILKVCQNDEQAFRTLLKVYEPFIYKNIHVLNLDYADRSVDKDDLYQEACIALCEACKSYREDMKCKFSSFAYLVIRRKLLSYYRKMNAPMRKEIKSLDGYNEFYHSKLMSNYARIHYEKEKERLAKDMRIINDFMNTLSPIEKEIVNQRYGKKSFIDIAKTLNMNTKTLYKRVYKIRQKFKSYKTEVYNSDELETVVGY